MISEPVQFSQGKERVRTIIKYEPNNPKTMKVDNPEKVKETDGYNVVNKHLPEVLFLPIKHLRQGQGPIKGELQHVEPPDIPLNLEQIFFHKKEKKTA